MADDTKKAPYTNGVSTEGVEKNDYGCYENSSHKDTKCRSKSQVPTDNIERISDVYYQVVTDPQGNEQFMNRKREELKQDNVNLREVPKFTGFTVEHARYNIDGSVEYRRDVDGWRNMAQILPHEPIEGDFKTIAKLIKHIGCDKEELLLDYITILLTNPTQLLPIIVVVSKAQATGKSTFLRFIKALLLGNAVILNVSQYTQQFNGLYASKLAIMIDEAAISEEFIKERLKNDSTQLIIYLRKMMREHTPIPFYGKFLMATNKETDFVKLEEEDVRFLVLKVETFEEFDPEFEYKLVDEIPQFIYYLLHRPLETPTARHRMWFAPEQLRTDALAKVMMNSRSECAKDIEIWAEDLLNEKIGFGATRNEIWEALGRRYSRNEISNALKKELRLDNDSKRYVDMYGFNQIGRAFIFGDRVEGMDSPI